MAAKLADELLQMFLAPSLTVPRNQFISSSFTAFGQNDAVSSGSVLLVCKRWLRVATPLLYETIVIRSTGQSKALADALRQNPAFAQHVKKIRLEGAYASLGDVLTRCSNLKTLVFLFRIYSDANVNGLCCALPRIDPMEVILYDEYPGPVANAKLRKAFIALCDAIPAWKNLTTFEFPYIHNRQSHATIEPGVTKQTKLVDALSKSHSIRVLTCEALWITDEAWRHLAKIPSITFKVRYFSQYFTEQSLVEEIFKDPLLSKCPFEFIDLSEPKPSDSCIMENTEKPHNQQFRLRVPESVWTTIFAFATIPEPPARCTTSTFMSFSTTRKHLSLVCKMFERLVRPIAFAFPIMRGHNALSLFTRKVLREPILGRQVQMLIVQGSFYQGNTDADLCALIPHLSRLRHFIGWGVWGVLSISAKVFELLAKSTGSTLMTLTGIRVRLQHHRLPMTIFNSFECIELLDLDSDKFFLSSKTSLPRDSLCTSSLRALRIGDDANLLNTFSELRLPLLTSITFTRACNSIVGNFLTACGSQIEELNVTGTANFVDVFQCAPNLRELRWSPESFHLKLSVTLAAALDNSAAHSKLEKIMLDDIPCHNSGEKEQTAIIRIIFSSLDFKKFPSLKEIHFSSYSWPVDERSILKDLLPKMAVQVKQKYGVHVTDREGQPWRPRVQRR